MLALVFAARQLNRILMLGYKLKLPRCNINNTNYVGQEVIMSSVKHDPFIANVNYIDV